MKNHKRSLSVTAASFALPAALALAGAGNLSVANPLKDDTSIEQVNTEDRTNLHQASSDARVVAELLRRSEAYLLADSEEE